MNYLRFYGKLEDKTKLLQFVTIKELSHITGWRRTFRTRVVQPPRLPRMRLRERKKGRNTRIT